MAEIGDELEINDWLIGGRIELPTPQSLQKYITISLNEGDLVLFMNPNRAAALISDIQDYIHQLNNIHHQQETS